MDQQASLVYVSPKLSNRVSLKEVAIQSWSDGAHRRRGVSAAGAVVKAWHKHWTQPKVLTAVAVFYAQEDLDSNKAEVAGL
eukprot:8114623-Karenia_brevis.AAC.1